MRGQAQIMHSELLPLSALSIIVLLPIFASHSIIFTQTTTEARQNTSECMFTRGWPSVWTLLGSLLLRVSLRWSLLAFLTGLDIGNERGGY